MQAEQTANGFRTLKAGLLKAALMNFWLRVPFDALPTICRSDQISAHTDSLYNPVFRTCALLVAWHTLALTPGLLSLYSGIHF